MLQKMLNKILKRLRYWLGLETLETKHYHLAHRQAVSDISDRDVIWTLGLALHPKVTDPSF